MKHNPIEEINAMQAKLLSLNQMEMLNWKETLGMEREREMRSRYSFRGT